MSRDVEVESYVLEGGLDLVTPYLQTPPGRARDGFNMECRPKGGYARVSGYLAYDGQVNADLDPDLPDAVPGTGPVRGVWIYNSDVYAVRDFDGSTARLYKATAGGWVNQALGNSLRFDGATDEFAEGDTVTGGTSGATGTVARVVYSGGLIDDATAFGVLVLTGVVGTFVDNEDLEVSAVAIALANGPVFANTLTAGGTFRFVNNNFYGQASQRRMYAAYGTGFAFEWDGTVFAPIENGVSEFPTTIAVHKEHLFLGYVKGSIMSSSLAVPLEFNVLTGAAEIAVGDEILDLQKLVGGVLMIGCRNRIEMLYGNDSDTWNKQPYVDHGVRGNTAREIAGKVLVLDDSGIQQLSATQAYGDFSTVALSYLYADALSRLVRQGDSPVVLVSKNKSQYRIYFGLQGFHLTFDGPKYVGAFPVRLSDEVVCACAGEDSTGNEMMLFGSDDGFVYQMETTNYFNGDSIPWRMQLAFGYQKAPTRRKQYKRVTVDAAVIGEDVVIAGLCLFDFDRSPSANLGDVDLASGGLSYWGVGEWGEFRWAAPLGTEAVLDSEGLGNNMSVVLSGSGDENSSITFNSAVAHYLYRRLNR